MKIELNKIFTIIKGDRKVRWKIVEHPYFDSYAIVRDYSGLYGAMKSGKCTEEDMKHIGFGGDTLEEAYKSAYDHT